VKTASSVALITAASGGAAFFALAAQDGAAVDLKARMRGMWG